ncbi:hypothetical protein MLD38_006547 [Melastoma candidum]|uniref:Uncharacterized protein n=1 Tax=Melastoma candidum TaxID=119954 RepID=A0ACB9RPD2_9MYRT|nr:hypothetical protein MLD38_006547 [Melastoma candidum]
MASTSKLDLSSSSADRPLYGSGQRGSHTASMDNSLSSSHPISRSGSCATQNDVANFFQCLPFDSKSLAIDHKSGRPADVKRNISVALGILPDDALPNCSKAKILGSLSLDELKKVQIGLRDGAIKSRERVKIFSDALVLLSKFFPSVSTKKRSRSEVLERSGSVLSNDRTNLGSGLPKTGNHSGILAGSFEPGLQKSEERTKGSSVPNKRTRTSMFDGKMEARTNSFVRPTGPVDREKESPKLATGGISQCEDRTLSSNGVEGWENSKMKKKRSGIKPDVSSVVGSIKPGDGYREFKQGMQQRSINDVRKSNNDSNEVRPRVINGAIGNGKTEGIPQNTSFSARASIPKAELDSCSISADKKDRLASLDKERSSIKAVNKASCRDDLTSGSPISISRINPSIRGPRSSSASAAKLSPSVNRTSASYDWEVSHCTNKAISAAGAPNRKRSASVRPPSPVACWPRPQKISRSARRRNFVPMVGSNDESSPVDSTSDVVGSDGLGFHGHLHSNSPRQAKLKSEPPSLTMLSEGEETDASDPKMRERLKKYDDMDEKLGQSLHKVSPMVVSSMKNKLISGEDTGDGMRKQGKSGHGFINSRTLLPVPGVKVGSEEATQLRSARTGFDSKERPGRPTSRKFSDRKAHNQQRHASVNVAADIMVGSEDGTEELMAAANAVVAPPHKIPSKMLEQLEAAFGFIYDEDIAFLKQQTSSLTPVKSDNCGDYLDIIGLLENEKKDMHDVHQRQKRGSQDQEAVPLWQRLIAALIPEEESEYCDTDYGDLVVDGEGSGLDIDGQIKPDASVYKRATDHRYSDSYASHDYLMSGSTKQQAHDNDIADLRGSRITSSSNHPINGLLTNPVMMPSIGCSEAQYASMSLDERVLLEMQSISIFPEDVSNVNHFEDDGITDDIQKMVKKHRTLASQKKGFLEKLLKDSIEAKESQERGFEQSAMDKLVTVTYQKYMTCWGPSNAKSAANKMAKQAALTLVKHTIQQCKQYELTRKSCFAEPLYKNIFLNGTSHRTVVSPVEAVLEASKNSQHSPSLSQQGLRGNNQDINSSDMLLSEQASGKDDMWPNRVKKKELLLQEVGGVASVIGNTLSSNTKGKRSERDRDGKGKSREMLSRPGNNKNGRSTLLNSKGERKSKAKPKQKMTQLSISINGLLGNTVEKPKSVLSTGSKLNPVTTSSNSKSFAMNTHDDAEAIDLSSLQIPEIDEFGVSDNLGGQGQDLDSWLNIDDDNLHGDDFMGLEIPMDDLSDVKLML